MDIQAKDMPDEAKPGRPTKFNERVADKILELAEAGKTEEQIAEIIGVHVNTLRNWKGKHPEFLWALKEAKLSADELVEASLFSRAVGYSHPEVKVFCEKGMVTEVEVRKHYAPDVTAAIFWLKNRKPQEWRDKQDIEHSGEIKGGVEKLSDEELEERFRQLMAKRGISEGE